MHLPPPPNIWHLNFSPKLSAKKIVFSSICTVKYILYLSGMVVIVMIECYNGNICVSCATEQTIHHTAYINSTHLSQPCMTRLGKLVSRPIEPYAHTDGVLVRGLRWAYLRWQYSEWYDAAAAGSQTAVSFSSACMNFTGTVHWLSAQATHPLTMDRDM